MINRRAQTLMASAGISSDWKRFCGLLVLAVATAFLGGCDTEVGESIYDPDRQSLPDPVINSVEPAGAALAGVDVVTISGQNFAPEKEDVYVYFGQVRGEVISASQSTISVLPPNSPQPALDIRVSVIGAENFSNGVPYRLDSAADLFGAIAGFEEPFGIATDDAGNLYMSLFSTGVSGGIIRIAPDGVRSPFVQTTFKWDGMAFGPDGLLYAIRGVRATFRFAEGAAQETWAVIPESTVKLAALTFDDAGNLWVGGPNANLYRISPDKTIAEYPFAADVTGLTVFGDALFATASKNGSSSVWRFQFDSDGGVGAETEYAAITGPFGSKALSIAAASTGELFVGTDGPNPMILVGTDRSTEVFYPGILQPRAISLAWGVSPTLYMSRGRSTVATPNLIKINTRREGAR